MSNATTVSPADVIITNVESNDVIFGPGQGPRSHSGNKFYHKLVRENRQEYYASNSRQHKTIIAYRIVHTITKMGGRFVRPLRPHEAKQYDCHLQGNRHMYDELDLETSVKKTKQALRDAGKTTVSTCTPSSSTQDSSSSKTTSSTTITTATFTQDSTITDTTADTNTTLDPLEDFPVLEEDCEAAEALFGILTFDDAPKHTAEDEQREQAESTEEEQHAALADLFGSLYEIFPKPAKRLKRPAAAVRTEPIESLVEAMEREVQSTPTERKEALMEARKVANASEFCRERMELFLRRDDFDPQKAAHRMIKYWEERRKYFGPDKYCLPMTPTGALRDDHVALKSGLCQLLPGLDASGRQLMWVSVKNNTREGYDTKSMTRAFWYFYETALQHPNAAKGIIQFGTAKDSSLWDFDFELNRTLKYLEKNAFPLTICATHLCCMPTMYLRLFLPIFLATYERGGRFRTIVHNIPDDQVVEALSYYGIPEELVPTEIGGKCEVNQLEWVAKRQAEGK